MAGFVSGRGRIATATRRAVRTALGSDGSAAVLAVVAVRVAAMADGAAKDGAGREFLAAVDRLERLLQRLDGGPSGERGDGAGEPAGRDVDGDAGGLAAILGSGPAVGDAADA